MTKIQFLFLSLFYLLPAISAQADIFTCRDSAGHLITSDRAVAECADKTTQVYTNSGVLKDKLAGALTPEQRRTAELLEQQKTKEALLEEQTQKEIRYLTAHYPTEQDVEIARQRELDAIDVKIAKERQTVDETTETLNRNRNQQKHIPKNQVDAAVKAKNEEDGLMQIIQQSDRQIQRYIAEKSNINRRFDDTHKRYSELVSPNKK